MQAVIAAVLSALLMGAGAGFGVARQIDNAQIERLENAVALQKDEAKAALDVAVSQVDAAQAKAKETNANLEKAHDSAIKTINTYRDLLATARLSDPGRRQSRANALSASTNTGIAEGEAGTGELSAELTRFLQIRFYSADKIAEYANQCYAFVVEQNCGISTQPDNSTWIK
jgi:multidrug efflux pump subunit AcrA (membrane-fusion protein)